MKTRQEMIDEYTYEKQIIQDTRVQAYTKGLTDGRKLAMSEIKPEVDLLKAQIKDLMDRFNAKETATNAQSEVEVSVQDGAGIDQ